MMMNPPYDIWLQECSKQITGMQNRSRIISWTRLFSFIAMALTFYLGLTTIQNLLLLSLAFFIGFIILIILQQKAWAQLSYLQNRRKALEEEVAAMDHRYVFPAGDQYIDPQHPYTYDLDIFGQSSLFAAINRTTTKGGSDRLANLLMNPELSPDVIMDRQTAIKELSEKPEWLLNFRVFGMQKDNSSPSSDQLPFEVLKPLFLSPFFKVLIILTPVLSISMIALLSLGYISIGTFGWYLILPLAISGIYAGKILKTHSKVSRRSEILLSHSKRLILIEEESFRSTLLSDLQNSLNSDGVTAGKAIRQLSRIITSMDARLNWLMWIILNYLLLWDIRQMRRYELWQLGHQNHMPVWFNTLYEMEALASQAGFTITNPNFCFPVCSDEPLHVKATEAGHPLIDPTRRIDNPISIRGTGSFNIITGANMAGKSTYLRTTGINLILAMTGMPVCAASFTFYPAQVFTSLHTLDSLSSNKSYFFAELERLKMIIDRLQQGEQLYILLDEILKGTNSHDKQQGSKALLRQLTTHKASGLIATHDLDLGTLEQSYPNNIANYSFEAEITNNELSFSYKLQNGIARNMNATFLMKQMGITLK